MKKLGGIIVGVAGAALAVAGGIAIAKSKNDDTCVELGECAEESAVIEYSDVEESEE